MSLNALSTDCWGVILSFLPLHIYSNVCSVNLALHQQLSSNEVIIFKLWNNYKVCIQSFDHTYCQPHCSAHFQAQLDSCTFDAKEEVKQTVELVRQALSKYSNMFYVKINSYWPQSFRFNASGPCHIQFHMYLSKNAPMSSLLKSIANTYIIIFKRSMLTAEGDVHERNMINTFQGIANDEFSHWSRKPNLIRSRPGVRGGVHKVKELTEVYIQNGDVLDMVL